MVMNRDDDVVTVDPAIDCLWPGMQRLSFTTGMRPIGKARVATGTIRLAELRALHCRMGATSYTS
jgi:hypothetical protein